MVTITLNIPDTDVQRIQAAATALGKTPKQLVTDFLSNLVMSYEQQQNSQHFTNTFTDIQIT